MSSPQAAMSSTGISTDTSTSTSTSVPVPKSSFARLAALAKAEWLQFSRNKLILFMALVFPVGMPLFTWFALNPETEAEKQAAGSMAMEMYLMIALLMVLFYSILSMATTRRDEGVLKRLRTGEAHDGEILTAIAIPGAIVTIGFFSVMVIALLLVGSFPAMLPLTLLALLLGLVVYAASALVTCAYTKNAEAAQLTSMPVFALVILSMSNIRVQLPEGLRHFLELTPFSAIFDLGNLGWAGTTYDKFGADAAALPTAELIGAAVTPLLVSVVWIGLLVWSVALYMRWDTHRG